MTITNNGRARIELCGDWSIAGVSDQLQRVVRELKNVLASELRQPEIDMGAVERIDLVGCQLLAIWLRSMGLSGCRPKLVNLPAEFRGYYSLLGFSNEFDTLVECGEMA